MQKRVIAGSYSRGGGCISENNILIIHDSLAGDFITTTAAIREIRRVYTESHITLVVTPQAFNLAECCPYVDEVIMIDNNYNWGSFSDVYRNSIETATRLLERRFNICFALVHTLIAPLLMYMSGAEVRIAPHFNDVKESFGYKPDVPFNELIRFLSTHQAPIYKFGRHVVDAHLSLLDDTLHSPVKNRDIEVWYTAADVSVARNLLRKASSPIYALSMGSAQMSKNYLPQYYAQVMEMIVAEEPTATFVILGAGEKDLIFAQIVKDTVPKIYAEHVIDLVNKISYRQCGAVLKLCDIFIGNETGNMHIAAAMKRPALIVACFPADLPASYTDGIRSFYPYKVPSVIILPAHALPECKVNEPYYWLGCRSIDKPHCITQIRPQTVFTGLKILRERISKNISEPMFIC